jgi:hypothetical protein
MNPRDLLPHFPGLRISDITLHRDGITVTADRITPDASCPQCGIPGTQVHSRYRRTLTDQPLDEHHSAGISAPVDSVVAPSIAHEPFSPNLSMISRFLMPAPLPV